MVFQKYVVLNILRCYGTEPFRLALGCFFRRTSSHAHQRKIRERKTRKCALRTYSHRQTVEGHAGRSLTSVFCERTQPLRVLLPSCIGRLLFSYFCEPKDRSLDRVRYLRYFMCCGNRDMMSFVF